MVAVAVLLPLLTVLLSGVHSYDNGVGALPPMGWNSWCTDDACGARDYCTDREVRSVAEAMVAQNLTALGYRYVNLDDCWSAQTRDAQGRLQADAKRFPNGMKSLISYVHSLGLKMGLYTCVGTKTCRGDRPGSYGNYELDAQTLAEWGVDFVKADNCNRPSGTDGKDLYEQFSQALNATGRPILFSLCNWGDEDVTSWGADVGQMFRIQMDHIPFWHFPPLAAGEGFGQGVYDIIRYMATLKPSTIVKPYGYMDPDFLETLFPVTMPYNVSRVEVSFWSLWSAPLLVATDLRHLSQEKRSLIANHEVIAVDQDPLCTAGDQLFENADHTQAWAKPLHDGSMAVILFNPNSADSSASITLQWSQLGWPSDATVAVRDLWTHSQVGSFSGSITRQVAGHDVFMFRATRTQ
eukprot:CAMPEP_0177647550 /NCGR_PEP_ID=MMETSP0447-20121125/10358_1 /TAXON_ID=0 /ORGANISM="Stygamoeba regulata, Strain BSH-02190019" /LENGTH=408 /DNA_ID=CAMNT_0019150139 /DNA_START=75 /DNA_END=1301 /DNA_ORIENTATION=+